MEKIHFTECHIRSVYWCSQYRGSWRIAFLNSSRGCWFSHCFISKMPRILLVSFLKVADAIHYSSLWEFTFYSLLYLLSPRMKKLRGESPIWKKCDLWGNQSALQVAGGWMIIAEEYGMTWRPRDCLYKEITWPEMWRTCPYVRKLLSKWNR